MTTLTEQAAEHTVAARAFDAGPPGFVGAAVDLLLARPGLPEPVAASLAARPPLRHGFLTARSPRVLVVSGPPSPGVETCLSRMAVDLTMPLPLVTGHGVAVLDVAGDGETAGIRVALEAGLEAGGPLGLGYRWRLAHTLGPVLAAAFANAPAGEWRSVRQARHRHLPVLAPGDPRAAWVAFVLDAPGADGRPFRERVRAGAATAADLDRHLASLRPPVAARGHLELDVADRQPGAGWRLPIAVAVALLDDPRAAAEAAQATGSLAGEPRLWERAARDALTDPVLAAAARDCFPAAYAALARQGADRGLRDALADFTERYVLRGRCPADDLLGRTLTRPTENAL